MFWSRIGYACYTTGQSLLYCKALWWKAHDMAAMILHYFGLVTFMVTLRPFCICRLCSQGSTMRHMYQCASVNLEKGVINLLHITSLENTNVINKADSRLVPRQWETSLQSNAVSHWIGSNLQSTLIHVYKVKTIQIVIYDSSTSPVYI